MRDKGKCFPLLVLHPKPKKSSARVSNCSPIRVFEAPFYNIFLFLRVIPGNWLLQSRLLPLPLQQKEEEVKFKCIESRKRRKNKKRPSLPFLFPPTKKKHWRPVFLTRLFPLRFWGKCAHVVARQMTPGYITFSSSRHVGNDGDIKHGNRDIIEARGEGDVTTKKNVA